MRKFTKLLGGIRLLEERNSPRNGKLSVLRSVAWGTYIQADGLTQSGGIVESIWKDVFKSLPVKRIENVLILGLGGGTITKLMHKKWPEAIITGVDIDPVIVDLGKKYLDLAEGGTKIVISDAFDYCKILADLNKKFDLIFVDLYLGDEFPKEFEKPEFLYNVNKCLDKEGLALFNRLYGEGKRGDAVRFMQRLEKEFSEVEPIYPEANVVMVCKR